MKDFDIAKFLRENQLGSYGILNHYLDIKPLNEEIDLDSFKDFFNKNYSHIYHNFSDRDIQNFLRGKESLPLEKQADLFADYITSQDLGDVVAEDLTPEETTEIPYKGPNPKLDGFGDEFEQDDTVSEEWYPDQTFDAEEMISSAVTKLTDAGISIKQIKQFVDKQLVASADSAVFERKNKF
jgi:hypothetical protein